MQAEWQAWATLATGAFAFFGVWLGIRAQGRLYSNSKRHEHLLQGHNYLCEMLSRIDDFARISDPKNPELNAHEMFQKHENLILILYKTMGCLALMKETDDLKNVIKTLDKMADHLNKQQLNEARHLQFKILQQYAGYARSEIQKIYLSNGRLF